MKGNIQLKYSNYADFSSCCCYTMNNSGLYNDNGNKRRIFQNFLDAKAGDMIIGYESTPVKQVVAILKISAEQDIKAIKFGVLLNC